MPEIKIPLAEYVKEYFPKTSLSTARYWAEAGVKGKGPFAGKIIKILGRWYVCEYKEDNYSIIDNILKDIDRSFKHE
jgi:hypothetical protein